MLQFQLADDVIPPSNKSVDHFVVSGLNCCIGRLRSDITSFKPTFPDKQACREWVFLEWAGEGSRAREVDMPHGDYRLSWAARGSGGYFSVRLEGGQSSLLVSDDPAEADSGEVFVQFPGGRHIVSVKASG
jgi:hypothetical protein